MMLKRLTKGEKLRFLPVDKIFPNPWQPRRSFDPKAMGRLAESIHRYGVLEPLVVQEKNGEYELVLGERRYRAAKLLDMKTIPCRIVKLSLRGGAELPIAENSLGERVDIFEEAEALERLLHHWRDNPADLATRLGMSQSRLLSKIRLLRFSVEERNLMQEGGLCEGYAASLLRLDDPAMRLFALHYILDNRLSQKGADELCETLNNNPDGFIASLQHKEKRRLKPVRRLVVKDVRLFINSVDRAIFAIREAGVDLKAEKLDEEGFVSYSIRVPKY